jgi:hypothetical protein
MAFSGNLSVGHLIAEDIENNEKNPADFDGDAVWVVVYFQDCYLLVPYFGYFSAQEPYYANRNIKQSEIGDAYEYGE